MGKVPVVRMIYGEIKDVPEPTTDKIFFIYYSVSRSILWPEWFNFFGKTVFDLDSHIIIISFNQL